MKKRKEINDRLVKWIANKVQTEYADDVSLVLIYGSYVNETANSRSDVDCYYIPKTERGYRLAVDFMIEGVGYDIYPISWERVERIADLLENMSPLVGDVNMIYCNSADDRERFLVLQERLKRNLCDDEYVKEIAARRCEEAGRLCARLRLAHSASAIRKIAGGVIMTLADAVAVYHHDYYHFGLKRQFEDLQNNFPGVPRNIVDGYRNVVEAATANDVIGNALQLFEDVCIYLGIVVTGTEAFGENGSMIKADATPETPGWQPHDCLCGEGSAPMAYKVDASCLASLYEEISSTFNKIYVCCESGDHILAFLSAVCLQRDLDDAGEAGCPVYELLNDFDYRELDKLSETAKSVERDLVQVITDHGGHIRRYDSFEEFEAAKL